MKIFLKVIGVCCASVMLLSMILLPVAEADVVKGLEGCVRQRTPDTRSNARFIWKSVAAHFWNNAVIVLPTYYTGIKADVEIYTNKATPKRVDECRLKSTGDCADSPECLFRQTFLANGNGASFRSRYRSIIVKIAPDEAGTNKECRYYVVKRPDRRAEFAG